MRTLTLRERYIQLAVLILAGGAIYPVLYLRQNFEVSLLDTYHLTQSQLGEAYSILGIMFVLGYLPSGWLADQFRPRWLLAGSMVATGLLAFWFATVPDPPAIRIIFACWGIATGFTFWGSLIKACSLLATHDKQGTFFGLLEGGRGAVEALLATIALALFSVILQSETSGNPGDALKAVVIFYGTASILLAPIIVLLINVPDGLPASSAPDQKRSITQLATNLSGVMGNERIWLSGIVILTGYQLFWATYSFSGLLQNIYGLSAVAAGTITVAKLWMRPIGAIAAGVIGDRFDPVRALAGLMLASSAALLALPLLPKELGFIALVGMVLSVGLITYGIRGIYWVTLDDCGVPPANRGLAIGLISLVGYAPDIYLPLLKAFCLTNWRGDVGYLAYYSVLAVGGIAGSIAAFRLLRLARLDRSRAESA